MYNAVGGLLRHGGALTAIACSTVNSYNGLVPRVGGLEGGTVTWAPTHMTYGNNNRSCMLRLPQNRFCIENRAADMCMNPYLALGDDDGGDRRRDRRRYRSRTAPRQGPLPAHGRGDPRRRRSAAAPHISSRRPRSCETIRWPTEVLGPAMLNSFLRYKVDEWERYHQAVTDWEVQEYLRLY